MIRLNKKADVNMQGMLIAIALVGLFAGLIAAMVTSLGGTYDISGYDEEQVQSYQVLDNLSQRVSEARDDIDTVGVDPSWFDFLSGIFNVILTPFKFMYNSISTIFTLTDSVVNDLGLLKIIGDFLITVTTIFIFIGIVMIKFYMGRQK